MFADIAAYRVSLGSNSGVHAMIATRNAASAKSATANAFVMLFMTDILPFLHDRSFTAP